MVEIFVFKLFPLKLKAIHRLILSFSYYYQIWIGPKRSWLLVKPNLIQVLFARLSATSSSSDTFGGMTTKQPIIFWTKNQSTCVTEPTLSVWLVCLPHGGSKCVTSSLVGFSPLWSQTTTSSKKSFQPWFHLSTILFLLFRSTLQLRLNNFPPKK